MWLTNECDASTQKALWAGFMFHVSEWPILALEDVALPEQSQQAIMHEEEKKHKKWRKHPCLWCTLNTALAKNSSHHALIENQWHLWTTCLQLSMFRFHGTSSDTAFTWQENTFHVPGVQFFALGNFRQMAFYPDSKKINFFKNLSGFEKLLFSPFILDSIKIKPRGESYKVIQLITFAVRTHSSKTFVAPSRSIRFEKWNSSSSSPLMVSSYLTGQAVSPSDDSTMSFFKAICSKRKWPKN